MVSQNEGDGPPGQPHTRQLDDRDLPALRQFLKPRIASSMIMISKANRAGLVNQGKPMQGIYVASFDNDRMTGVVAHYWNGIMILQAPHTAVALARHIRPLSAQNINGLIGPLAQVESVSQALMPAAAAVFDSPENLYSLALSDLRVPAVERTDERVRRALPSDARLLAQWSAHYNIELLSSIDSKAMRKACRAGVDRMIAQQDQWVLEIEGDADAHREPCVTGRRRAGVAAPARQLVSTCTFNATTDDCVQIGGVWTPAHLRSRGFARTVVAGALQAARQAGAARSILFTGQRNVAAQRAYQSLGFKLIGDYRIVLYRQPGE